MLTVASSPHPFWFAVTRLGEAQVMLPAAAALLVWLALRPSGRPLVGWWLGLMVAAVAVTTASKIAFIGFGLGLAELDFTGVSGHAMFAAVVYPLVFRVLTADRPAAWQRASLLAGIALAALVGYSRLVLGAHSLSEVLAGWGARRAGRRGGAGAGRRFLRGACRSGCRSPCW